MSGKKRAGSAMSTSSDELIDRQLNELFESSDGASERIKVAELVGDELADGVENVAVMVRCRPLQVFGANSTNTAAVVEVDEANRCVQVGDRQFYFDQVFGAHCDNDQVYMRSARRLVDCAFRGYNCTIFLYGQTGTGKTFTHSSLTLSAFEHLFSLIQDSNETMSFLIRASYYELYNEEIHDLLAPRGASRALELRESKERGVYVKDLTCFLVNNLADLKKLKQLGDQRRTTASTQMNEHSSRSHSIFSITIETISSGGEKGSGQRMSAVSARVPSAKAPDKKAPVVRVGHLNLIDLAGSERQSKSGSSGARLKEASQINFSLTCLSLVIRALTDKSTSGVHIPYRNSKLTRLLSSSLGGNSKTVLIACISAAKSNLEETLNTLRFASRTKQIKNKAVVNEDAKDALLRKYRRQLDELRRKLSEQQRPGTEGSVELCGERENDTADQEILERLGETSDDERAAKLVRQLELLKAKIMHGGENLLDKLELHERLIETNKAELEERRGEEAKLRERLQSKKQTIEQVVQSKGSLEGQLEYLDEKLARAISLYKSSKLELRDLASDHELLKEQLLQTIRSTSKEIKYVDCIIEDFIPGEHLDLINAYAQYDDASDEWQIKYIALSGNNIAQTKRLIASANSMSLTSRSEGSPADTEPGDQRPRTKGKTRRRYNLDSNRPDPYIRLK